MSQSYEHPAPSSESTQEPENTPYIDYPIDRPLQRVSIRVEDESSPAGYKIDGGWIALGERRHAGVDYVRVIRYDEDGSSREGYVEKNGLRELQEQIAAERQMARDKVEGRVAVAAASDRFDGLDAQFAEPEQRTIDRTLTPEEMRALRESHYVNRPEQSDRLRATLDGFADELVEALQDSSRYRFRAVATTISDKLFAMVRAKRFVEGARAVDIRSDLWFGHSAPSGDRSQEQADRQKVQRAAQQLRSLH